MLFIHFSCCLSMNVSSLRSTSEVPAQRQVSMPWTLEPVLPFLKRTEEKLAYADSHRFWEAYQFGLILLLLSSSLTVVGSMLRANWRGGFRKEGMWQEYLLNKCKVRRFNRAVWICQAVLCESGEASVLTIGALIGDGEVEGHVLALKWMAISFRSSGR